MGLLASLLAACEGEPAAPPLPTEGKPVAPVDEGSVLASVEALGTDRFHRSAGHVRAREAIVARLEGWDLAPVVLPFRWEGLEQASLANVELRIPGTRPEAEVLCVTAHYDTVVGTPGADDNGSGAGALLELARRLGGRRFVRELRLVWFDAEEVGMLGSVSYLRDLGQAGRERIAGCINLEAIGFTDRRPGSQRMPAGVRTFFDPGDRGDFLLVLGNLASRSLASAVHDGLQEEQGPAFRAEVMALLPGAGWVLPDARRSDHAPFWDQQIPAVMVTDTANFRNPHYHGASDTIGTLDAAFLAAAVRGLERAVVDLAGVP